MIKDKFIKKQVAPIGATCLILKPCHFERAKRLRNLNYLCSDFSHTLEMTMNGHDKKLLPVPEQIHELLAGLCLIEGATEVGCCGYGILLFHATHLHAQVLSLDNDHHS